MFGASSGGRIRLQHLTIDGTEIFLACPEQTSAAEAAILSEKVLRSEERARISQARAPQLQHDRILARALVRLGLSAIFPIPPNEWSFRSDRHQKPFLVSPAGFPAFQFSLSHCKGLIALLVSSAECGGVDVEQLERANDLALVAAKVCAASELESLHRLTADERRERFFQLWTLKEAYAKARGLGLALPWQEIAFDIGTDRAVSVRFGSKIDDTPAGWRFSIREVSPVHFLAWALREASGREMPEPRLRAVRVSATAEKQWLEPANPQPKGEGATSR